MENMAEPAVKPQAKYFLQLQVPAKWSHLIQDSVQVVKNFASNQLTFSLG